MAEKRESECTSTYCHIMKKKHWRAALFDWQFANTPDFCERSGIQEERKRFVKRVKELNFEVYSSVKETRSLSKINFLKELQRFKELCVSEPCGCILLTISSHGTFIKTDDQRDGGDLEIFEDCILACDNSSIPEQVPLKEIFEVFRDERLKQIPKIFFIQACRGKVVDRGFDLEKKKEDEQVKHQYDISAQTLDDKAHSSPYLENSVTVYSTPFGYSAASSTRWGSRVWEILMETIENILKQVEVNGPVDLLSWLKETNRCISKSDEFEIQERVGGKDIYIPYKPLLSICHTLTKQIILKKVHVDEKKG